MARTPLKSRPLDLLYFVFFLVHIPATLLVDLHGLWPPALTPEFTKRFISFYIDLSGDTLIASVNDQLHGVEPFTFVWFRSFLWLELIFQLPVFVLGARALWNDTSSIYVLLLVYGASTATTTLPCLTTVIALPGTQDAQHALHTPAITDAQRLMLLSSYVPFFLVPLLMTVDMAWRLHGMVRSTTRPANPVPAHHIKAE